MTEKNKKPEDQGQPEESRTERAVQDLERRLIEDILPAHSRTINAQLEEFHSRVLAALANAKEEIITEATDHAAGALREQVATEVSALKQRLEQIGAGARPSNGANHAGDANSVNGPQPGGPAALRRPTGAEILAAAANDPIGALDIVLARGLDIWDKLEARRNPLLLMQHIERGYPELLQLKAMQYAGNPLNDEMGRMLRGAYEMGLRTRLGGAADNPFELFNPPSDVSHDGGGRPHGSPPAGSNIATMSRESPSGNDGAASRPVSGKPNARLRFSDMARVNGAGR